MENGENRADHALQTQQRWFLQVMDRAVDSGRIDQHELDFWMRQLKVEPETIPKVYEQLQKLGVQVIPPEPDRILTPQERSILRGMLEAYGRELSEREQKFFVLRYLEGRSPEEIAEQEGLRPERIRQLNNKALRKISSMARRNRDSKKTQDFED